MKIEEPSGGGGKQKGGGGGGGLQSSKRVTIIRLHWGGIREARVVKSLR